MKTSLALFCIIAGLVGKTQSASTLIKEADNLERSLKEVSAYNKFREVLRIDPRNYYALWKCSELCSRIGNRQQTKKAKEDYFRAGKIYAETAIKVNQNGADGYYALAVAMGRKALIESGNERINAVREIKINAEKAISLNPNHGRAWHVIGKWHYEVSNLNAIEKAALKVIYGGLPKASIRESIAAYEKAKNLEPVFALNNLELAKAYHRNSQNEKAIALLKVLPSIPNKTEDDPRIKEEGRLLLQKLLN